jgi:hypothetical protein
VRKSAGENRRHSPDEYSILAKTVISDQAGGYVGARG